MKIPVNTLKAYAYLLPENEPRPYLNGLHFSKRRNQIECSNGRFLAWEKFDCSELEDDIIVPTQAIKDILKITREEEKHIELTAAKIGRLDYRLTDTRNFPDAGEVIRKYQDAPPEDELSYSYDLRYLELFARAAVLRNNGTPDKPKTVLYGKDNFANRPVLHFTSDTFKDDKAYFEDNGFNFLVMRLAY